MDITYIRRRISELTKEKEMMEGFLLEAMTNAIYEIAKENPNQMKKIGNHMMVINSSQLLGKVWSSEFFNWEESAAAVLNWLSGTPVTGWKKKLTDLLESKGDVVELKKRGKIWYDMTAIVQRTPIDRRFIEKVIEKI